MSVRIRFFLSICLAFLFLPFFSGCSADECQNDGDCAKKGKTYTCNMVEGAKKCTQKTNTPDGNTPDGNTPDGNTPDGSNPDGEPTLPDGEPTLPDGEPTLPDGEPTLPDGEPTLP
ncbi:hypothetical protein L6R29_23765, partial [Myxococcota bacterium]|nr:hypothetical protein [Myxococcota bacterium]